MYFISAFSLSEVEEYIVSLEPEMAMSTPTYDPFGSEPPYKSKLFLCQMGHKQK